MLPGILLLAAGLLGFAGANASATARCLPGQVIIKGTTSASIQNAVNANGTNTSFCVKGGPYVFTAPVVPKNGDTFDGHGTLAKFGRITLTGNNVTNAFDGTNAQNITGVTIKNFKASGFAPASQRAALDRNPNGWTITNNEVAFNGQVGIEAYGGTTSANHVHDNGTLGIFVFQSTGTVITGNEIDHNNTSCSSQSVEAGGIKVAGTTNIQITSNNIHDNWGDGIWTDTFDTGFTISGNTLLNNEHHGIKIEAMSGAGTVATNTVTNSGFFFAPCATIGGDGINFDGGTGTTTYSGNTVTCSAGTNYGVVNGARVIDGGGNVSNPC